MSEPHLPSPRPGDPIEEHERQTTIRQIQQAMADGHLDFEEIDARFERVYQAENRAELVAVVADLPMRAAPVTQFGGHPLPASNVGVFGDLKVGGWVAVDSDLSYAVVFGDIVVDLSSAQLPDEVEIKARSVFGDTVVIVPDGVRASLESTLVAGDRKIDLAPARPNAPTVRVKSTKVFGDVKLYSLSRVPEGRFRKLWRTLRSAA